MKKLLFLVLLITLMLFFKTNVFAIEDGPFLAPHTPQPGEPNVEKSQKYEAGKHYQGAATSLGGSNEEEPNKDCPRCKVDKLLSTPADQLENVEIDPVTGEPVRK